MSSGHSLAIGQVSKSLVIGDLGAEILIPLFLSQVAIGDLAGEVLPSLKGLRHRAKDCSTLGQRRRWRTGCHQTDSRSM